jgi:hypothetical protein
MIADRFWDSAGAMARQVDLVVLAHPVAVKVRSASSYLTSDITVFEVAIDEVLRGTPVTRHDGLIELEMYYGPPPDAGLGLPTNQHLMFLRNVAARNEEYGQPATAIDHYSYNFPSLYQNLLVEVEGEVFVPAVDLIRRDRERDFPAELHGRSFEEVLAHVRDAATNAAWDETSGIGSTLFAC